MAYVWSPQPLKTNLHKSRLLHGDDPGEMATVYGYARVSTEGQELDSQLVQLRAAGCSKIYCEKKSGVVDGRRELRRLLRKLRRGDVVIVSALDRLTRGGPFKMLSVLQEITSRGASYRSLAEPWADTTHEFGEVLAAIVGYIGRKTREDILRRTSVGRARARANGVRFGRPPKLTTDARNEIRRRFAAGEEAAFLARVYAVSPSTVRRLLG